jgi:hypothetical protein
MIGNLVVWFANKNDLVSKIQRILQSTYFCGQKSPDTERLELLLAKFDDKIRFVIEFPYVDRHYRDTYYSFHSAKFNKTGRNCIRVHLFEGEVTEADLSNKENRLDERYRGFFIIRPLMYYILGRSLISPKAFKEKEREYVCCLMKARVSLLGNEFTVHGFPHIVQDEESHTCAESALWSYIEYFGSKYPQYKPLLPSQIIKNLLDNAEHRLLPSEGLTAKELAKCLQNNGFQCQSYRLDFKPDTKVSENSMIRMLQIYIESGIPLLLVLNGGGHGHAVLAIGHEENDSLYDVRNHSFPKDASWTDVSGFNKRLVLIDDNMPPYQITDISRPAEHYSDPELSNMVIESFIVPFPIHMFLVAKKAYALTEKIFNTEKVGLQTNGGKWITRLFLTGSHSFKNFLLKDDDKLEPELKRRLLRLPMPRFIWACEVYKAHEFTKDGHCSGLLIIDATGDRKSLASVLWYAVDRDLFLHDNVSWDEKASEKMRVPFRMKIYRNNLKGAWNGWT